MKYETLRSYGKNARRDSVRLAEILANRDAEFNMGNMGGRKAAEWLDKWPGRLTGGYLDTWQYDRSLGDIDYVVWSYRTPIAWHRRLGRGWVVNTDQYSATTTSHQHKLRVALSDALGVAVL